MDNPPPFDEAAARKNLAERERNLGLVKEAARLKIFEKCCILLKEKFSDKNVEVYLVGSILNPGQFREDSDVDIVLKGFAGDRFEIWAELERSLNHFRPQVIQQKTLIFLDKIRSFRHFIRHAYDCDLDKQQLLDLQSLIKQNFHLISSDLDQFRGYIQRLSFE